MVCKVEVDIRIFLVFDSVHVLLTNGFYGPCNRLPESRS